MNLIKACILIVLLLFPISEAQNENEESLCDPETKEKVFHELNKEIQKNISVEGLARPFPLCVKPASTLDNYLKKQKFTDLLMEVDMMNDRKQHIQPIASKVSHKSYH